MQRYGCPATGGVVEGRKSTVKSVGEHGSVELTKSSILFLLVITMKTNNGSTNKAHAFSFTMTFTIEIEGHPIPSDQDTGMPTANFSTTSLRITTMIEL